jgi:hypothetical protein
MHKQVLSHVEETLNEIRSMFMEVASRIENLKGDDKITKTKLADDLAAERGLKRTDVYPLINMLVNNYPKIGLSAGCTGGIRRLETWEKETDEPNH